MPGISKCELQLLGDLNIILEGRTRRARNTTESGTADPLQTISELDQNEPPAISTHSTQSRQSEDIREEGANRQPAVTPIVVIPGTFPHTSVQSRQEQVLRTPELSLRYLPSPDQQALSEISSSPPSSPDPLRLTFRNVPITAPSTTQNRDIASNVRMIARLLRERQTVKQRRRLMNATHVDVAVESSVLLALELYDLARFALAPGYNWNTQRFDCVDDLGPRRLICQNYHCVLGGP